MWLFCFQFSAYFTCPTWKYSIFLLGSSKTTNIRTPYLIIELCHLKKMVVFNVSILYDSYLMSACMYRSWNKSFTGYAHIVVNFYVFHWSLFSFLLSSIIYHTIYQKLYNIDCSCLCICSCCMYILCTFVNQFNTS